MPKVGEDMKIAVFSCSLNANSRSKAAAKAASQALEKHGANSVTFVDLAEHPMPLCDGGPSYGNDNVQALQSISQEVDGILLATPVYNYTVNSAAKTLVEHVGRAWTNKTVGLNFGRVEFNLDFYIFSNREKCPPHFFN